VSVTASIRIAAPPEIVFPYFTDPALLARWLGRWADLDPEPGGRFAVDMERTAVRGRYLAVEPPTRLVFTWGIPGSADLPAGSSTVEVRLTEDGSETLVELVHRDLPPARQEGHQAGWVERLDGLAEAVLTH
jgi:uncharacterized protein YndB with AHSA1/START domain